LAGIVNARVSLPLFTEHYFEPDTDRQRVVELRVEARCLIT